MSAKGTFILQYQKAQGGKSAPAAVIKAACLYTLDLKIAGLSLDEITTRLEDLMRAAGGLTPETARLDADIMLHCVEEYHRPLPRSIPKPPDFIG
jgi:hypothetical protein